MSVKLTDLNFEEIKVFYENHSKQETCEIFNISLSTLFRLCKLHNYAKPKSAISALKKQAWAVNKQDPTFLLERKNKTVQTKIEKYGSLDNANTIMCKNIKKTKADRYGDENYNNRDKYKETCLEKFGYENPFQNEEIKQKCNTEEAIAKANNTRQSTFNSKYNVDFVGQLEKSHQNYTYKYDETCFDSSWELALWIYAKDHKEEIIRLPQTIEFEYNSSIHTYTPDFKYCGKLIEIKGDQFLSESGLINPYRDNSAIDSIKTELIKKYNIELWNRQKINPILAYIKVTYGKDYLKQFKITR